MPSIKIELFKGKTLSDGRHPVCVRVTNNGKVKRKTIASAHVKEWDEKKCRIKARTRPDFEKVNSDIDTELDTYEARYKELKRSERLWDPEEVFKLEQKHSVKFLETSMSYLEYIRANKSEVTYGNLESIHHKISRYVRGIDFSIEDINKKWIEDFSSYLRSPGLKNGETTITLNLAYIKRIIKRSGVKNEIVSDIKFNIRGSNKQKLTAQELETIENLQLDEMPNLDLIRDVFMIQYYLRGLRVADVIKLRKESIVGDRLIYTAGKTGKVFDIKIVPKCMDLINKYIECDSQYVLPLLRHTNSNTISDFENRKRLASEIKVITNKINSGLNKIAELAGIKKKIRSHIARHTFASMADIKLKGNIREIQAMLAHGDRKVTERYISELKQSDLLDEAADRIFT